MITKLILLLIFLPLNSLGQTFTYEILRVIDGDTVEIAAPFLPPPLKPTLLLRVSGVDTPEIHSPKCELESNLALEAKEFTENLIKNTKNVEVIFKNWDKYGGRVDGDLILDGSSLATTLILKGYGHPYFGEKKGSWCEE